jgi:hypothetical protein
LLHAIDLVRLRERSRTLIHIAAFTTADRVIGTGAEPAVVSTAPVSAEMLRPATDGPSLGRVFTDEEETKNVSGGVLARAYFRTSRCRSDTSRPASSRRSCSCRRVNAAGDCAVRRGHCRRGDRCIGGDCGSGGRGSRFTRVAVESSRPSAPRLGAFFTRV